MKTEDFPTSCDLYNTGSDKYTIPYQVDRDYASVPHEGMPDLDLMRNRKYSRVTPVTISSSQHWLHKSVGEIEVETTVKFFCDRKDANFKIGYIVKGSGLCGEGEEWALHNGYSNSFFAESVGPFCSLPPVIYDYIYNDVALVTKYAKGVDGSLPSEFHAGDEVTFRFIIPASEITEIRNLSGELLPVKYHKIKVISFVVDANTDEVFNSDVDSLVWPSGVESVEDSETVSVERFDINGNPVDDNYKGICIVREIKADGTVKSRKEVIR